MDGLERRAEWIYRWEEVEWLDGWVAGVRGGSGWTRDLYFLEPLDWERHCLTLSFMRDHNVTRPTLGTQTDRLDESIRLHWGVCWCRTKAGNEVCTIGVS